MTAKNKDSIEDLKTQLAHLQGRLEGIQKGEPQKFKVIDLYSWKSPERLYVPRNNKWFLYLFSLILIVILVLLFIHEFIIIAPVAAVGFVTYIIATVPPHIGEHKLTNEGINTANHSYLWSELYDFWLTEKYGETIVNIDTKLNYPNRLTIVVGEGDKVRIKEIMAQFIPFREIPKMSWMDHITDYLSSKFNKITS